MVKFRNVRVKMKGGKTRIQRAMVLASGKLKFVKNVGRKSASSHSKRSISHVSTHKKGGKNPYMAKKRRFGHKSPQQAVETIMKTGALLAPAAYNILHGGSGSHIAAGIIYDYTGYNIETGAWNAGQLVHGWAPVVGVTVGLKLAHKLTGLVRRL